MSATTTTRTGHGKAVSARPPIEGQFGAVVASCDRLTPPAPPALSARCRFAGLAHGLGLVWRGHGGGEGEPTRVEAEGALGRAIDPDDPQEWERAAAALIEALRPATGGGEKR